MDYKEYPPSVTSRSLEAQCSTPSDQQSDSKINPNQADLPPIDGGIHAWLFLTASAVLEAIVWGMLMTKTTRQEIAETNVTIGYAFAFGIFQDYYSTHEPFQGSENIAVIGTCAMVSLCGRKFNLIADLRT